MCARHSNVHRNLSCLRRPSGNVPKQGQIGDIFDFSQFVPDIGVSGDKIAGLPIQNGLE